MEARGVRRREALVFAGSLLLLAGLVIADFSLARQYVLIGYYGVPALVASASLPARRTAIVGLVAIACALIAGQWDDGALLSTADLISTGVVTSSAAVAVYVSSSRTGRERRLRAVSAVADTAQDAVLRRLPATIEGMRLASTYHSATAQARVGGDFYEAVAGPRGPRLLIGDVRGKGLPAVQLAGTVLGAFRYTAAIEPDLASVASALDATVSCYAGEEEFATALLVEVVEEGALAMVVCGHPPPMVGPPGHVRTLGVADPGLPLGMGGIRRVVTCPWRAGELMLLYTDGLIEARDAAGRYPPESAIASALASDDLDADLAALVHLATSRDGSRLDDDLALLLAYRLPCAGAERSTGGGSVPSGDHAPT